MDEWAKDTDNQMGTMPKIVTMLLLSVFPLTGLLLLGVAGYLIWLEAAASAPSVSSVVMDCILCLAPAAFCLYFGHASILYASFTMKSGIRRCVRCAR